MSAQRPQPPPAPARERRYLDACVAALRYAEVRGYRGYNKHDALNSPLLHALALDNKWLRLLLIQLVMRAPVNVRPYLRVRRTINPKGMALFARTYLTLHELAGSPLFTSSCEAQQSWLAKAKRCLEWLVNHSARGAGYSGHCWGYPYDWQDKGFFAPAGMPNCVVTCFVGRAFLHAMAVTGDTAYLEIARSACDFLLHDLSVLHESDDMLCLSYAPVGMQWVVMDTSALAAALLADVAKHTGSTDLQAQARRLMHYVVDKQTNYGAWYYSHPPGASHITHDNYHTGFILDALLEYSEASGDDTFLASYHQGLRFYAEQLFLPNGAPKWTHDSVYPHDVHGAAQGIITFSRAARFASEYRRLAEAIADWSFLNLYCADQGRFYYRQGRWWTKRFTLMRWCNAWMAWATASLLRSAAA